MVGVKVHWLPKARIFRERPASPFSWARSVLKLAAMLMLVGNTVAPDRMASPWQAFTSEMTGIPSRVLAAWACSALLFSAEVSPRTNPHSDAGLQIVVCGRIQIVREEHVHLRDFFF